MILEWYTSDSADQWHDDIEVDLEKIGSPGGASWAAVTDCGPGRWKWSVYDAWLWDDLNTLVLREVRTKEQAIAAVVQWVAQAHYDEWLAKALYDA